MTKNDILRRIRYVFDFSDDQMIGLFAAADVTVTRAQVSNWLKKDDVADFEKIPDVLLATFLNGLINQRRGRREGAQPEPEKRLNHNIVLRKLRIALDFKEEDMLAVLALADFRMGKHELSALFRAPTHKHYRECQDQVLRNFLNGLQIKFRGAQQAD
ncbi:hypothetical protein WH50_09145 [Pokkaliibacter plantistimulans]|uniref:DUF1456 family protein n=2 Tax=Pseudomonadota TaxID=1224 RepID=A0ABX5LZM2_9GAMM|nr:DUF1456 family protein [Pokkaliibacter plantistimulans]PPC78545.1 DUF1456 domain-containing protein [Pokkaliibacter plantistimulans]PXF31604.1 hypothetical protein WH50_09145 [Pokkaliibacter plantistimulans]